MPNAFVTVLDSFASSVVSTTMAKDGFDVTGSVSTASDLTTFPGSILDSDVSSISSAISSSSAVVVNLQGTDPAVLDVADSVLSMMKFLSPKSPMKLVVISSIGTWGNTVSSAGNPVDSSTYKWRLPSPAYANHKRLEDLAMSLSTVSPNLEVTLVCPGVLYGCGEEHFYMTFRDAWQHQTTAVLVPALSASNGSNTLPTTHVQDLAATVTSIVTSISSPVPPYTLLADTPSTTLSNITQSISDNINGTKAIRVMKDQNYENVSLEHPEFRTLNLNLFVDTSKCGTSSLPLKYAEGGICANMATVASQFVAARGLDPIRIAILSPPGLSETTSTLVSNIKGRYSLPLVSPSTCVDMLLKEEEGSSKVRDEVAAVWNAAEGGNDISKISPELMARAFRRALLSTACQRQGYILVDAPTSENSVNVAFSDEPPVDENAGDEEAEEEVPAKGKKDDKKKKKGGDKPPPIEPVVEFDVNPLKAPTHVINLAASDAYLTEVASKANTKETAEGEEEPTIDAEAVAAFKANLSAYRTQEQNFGLRPPKPEEDDDAAAAATEEKKDGDAAAEGAEGEDATIEKAEEKLPATSVHTWMEEKCNAKVLHLPFDEVTAEELSAALIPTGESQNAYIFQFVDDGETPGIVFMTAAATPEADKVPEPATEAAPAPEAAAEAPPASVAAPADAASSSLLPHEQVYASVTLEEAGEISDLTKEYRRFCSDNIMKEVTLGMMKILKNGEKTDIVDLLADHLIAEGKRLEKEGEKTARLKFDSLLQHVDALSSRILEGRRDDSTMATGTVFSGFSKPSRA